MSLNAREARLEREKKAAAANPPERLNPLFPFRRTPFDPMRFNLEADPPPAVDTPAADR
jgi:hypothetical protein